MATNLEFIKSESVVDGSSTFSVTDVFSDKYDVYYLYFDVGQTGVAATNINARLLDSSSTEISNANYDTAILGMNFGSAFDEYIPTAQTTIKYFFLSTGDTPAGRASPTGVYIYNPFSSSSYTFLQGQSIRSVSYGGKGIAVLKETTSCTGIKFLPENGSATFRTSKVSVYGVK
jgi:hypothetical protein